MAKIFVIRHGQTFDNKDEVFSGKRETDLTQEGIEEAKQIGEQLKNEKITKAYQSNQLRSKHTLELVLNGYHPETEIIEDSRIRKRDYGDLTGKKHAEIQEKDPQNYKLWHRSYDIAPPGGESIKDVEARVMDFLNEVIPTLKPDDIVLISAHGNSLRPMRKYFEGISNEQMCSFEHTPGKIYTYQV